MTVKEKFYAETPYDDREVWIPVTLYAVNPDDEVYPKVDLPIALPLFDRDGSEAVSHDVNLRESPIKYEIHWTKNKRYNTVNKLLLGQLSVH